LRGASPFSAEGDELEEELEDELEDEEELSDSSA
jgi:hypothetical protein